MQIKTKPVKLKAEGSYCLSVLDKEGCVIPEKSRGKTNNVVTYQGASTLFFRDASGLDMFGDIVVVVGTGTTELTRASINLGNQTEVTSQDFIYSRSGEVDNLDGTSTLPIEVVIPFALGAVVGTISEVGLAFQYNNKLIAGQLIKDEFGAPTTLTILADEQLVVTYTIELTIPIAPVSVAPLVGSGTVTTPAGSSDYDMYSQPFFGSYAVGSTIESVRSYLTSGRVSLSIADGSPFFSKASGSFSKVDDGLGTVTLTYDNISFSPGDGNLEDIKFIGVNAGNALSNNELNPTTKTSRDTVNNSTNLVIEFTPAITKTDQESLVFTVVSEYLI